MDSIAREYPEMEEIESSEAQVARAPLRKVRPKKEISSGEGQLTLDVFDGGSEIVIKSTIAGVAPEDLDISITNEMVTIKGERYMDEEVREKDYYYQELYWGSFSRSVILPAEVDADRATAVYKNGLLTIRLPKVQKSNSKRIKVTGY